MTSTVQTSTTTQVYRVYIKASAQAIWDAITQPEWSNRYGYTGFVDYDLRPGGAYKVRPNEESRRRWRRAAASARKSSSRERCWRPTRRTSWSRPSAC